MAATWLIADALGRDDLQIVSSFGNTTAYMIAVSIRRTRKLQEESDAASRLDDHNICAVR